MTRWGQIVTRVEGPPDEYGNPAEVETATDTRYELQQVRRDESPNPLSWQEGIYRLFLPAATDVSGVDGFIDDQDDSYEFDGPPSKVWHPRKRRVSHIEATVKRVT